MNEDCKQRVRSTWPERPYKGLSYYGPDDVALFAAREVDVRRCSALLALPETRTLLLHGQTGCGKSSFLRAGLIQALENEGFGFEFVKERREGRVDALFVRCTRDPLRQLADAVFSFVGEGYEFESPGGKEVLDLLPALGGARTPDEFQQRSVESGKLLKSLSELSRRLPSTLVLVLDQAEEVLTLNPKGSRALEARRFFEFLQDFSTSTLDLKLLIALRTEFFGRFYSAMKVDTRVQSDAREYLLADLGLEGVREAIERPTLKSQVGEFGIPFQAYGFDYEPGLADRIAADLMAARQGGGVLPVMQIVCRSLYNGMHEAEGERRITSTQYEAIGGVEGIIDEYITKAIRNVLLAKSVRLKEEDVERWHHVLTTLVSVQEDGSVTTRVADVETLRNTAQEHRLGNGSDIDSVLNALAAPDVLVLRSVSRVSKATGRRVDGFSLGHDAIGLSLAGWRTRYKERLDARKVARRGKIAAAIAIGLLAVIAAGFFLRDRWIHQGQMRERVERLVSQARVNAGRDYSLALLLALESDRILADTGLQLSPDPSLGLLKDLVDNGPSAFVRVPLEDITSLVSYGDGDSEKIVLCCGEQSAFVYDTEDQSLDKTKVSEDLHFLQQASLTPDKAGLVFWSRMSAPIVEIQRDGERRLVSLFPNDGSRFDDHIVFGAGLVGLYSIKQVDEGKRNLDMNIYRIHAKPEKSVQLLGSLNHSLTDTEKLREGVRVGSSDATLHWKLTRAIFEAEIKYWNNESDDNVHSMEHGLALPTGEALPNVRVAFAPDDSAVLYSLSDKNAVKLLVHLPREGRLLLFDEWRRDAGNEETVPLVAIGPRDADVPVAYSFGRMGQIKVKYLLGEHGPARELVGPSVTRLIFSQGGDYLVGFGNGQLSLWSLPTGGISGPRSKDDYRETICSWAPRQWTDDEWRAYGDEGEPRDSCERFHDSGNDPKNQESSRPMG